MFKIIAALAALAAFINNIGRAFARAADWMQYKAYRLSDAVQDVRSRILGAAISATSEHVVACVAERNAVYPAQHMAAQRVGKVYGDALMKLAEEHSAELHAIGRDADSTYDYLSDKLGTLRDKRAALRALL